MKWNNYTAIRVEQHRSQIVLSQIGWCLVITIISNGNNSTKKAPLTSPTYTQRLGVNITHAPWSRYITGSNLPASSAEILLAPRPEWRASNAATSWVLGYNLSKLYSSTLVLQHRKFWCLIFSKTLQTAAFTLQTSSRVNNYKLLLNPWKSLLLKQNRANLVYFTEGKCTFGYCTYPL